MANIVVTQFHDWAGSVSLAHLPINATNNLIMYSNKQVTFLLCDLPDQKLLTLCGCSFSQWGWEGVNLSFAYEGSQYIYLEGPHPITTQITHNTRPKIINAQLMLILPQAYMQYIIIYFDTI
jgi:hypothetical protein